MQNQNLKSSIQTIIMAGILFGKSVSDVSEKVAIFVNIHYYCKTDDPTPVGYNEHHPTIDQVQEHNPDVLQIAHVLSDWKTDFEVYGSSIPALRDAVFANKEFTPPFPKGGFFQKNDV